jgi:hypothetical protein
MDTETRLRERTTEGTVAGRARICFGLMELSLFCSIGVGLFIFDLVAMVEQSHSSSLTNKQSCRASRLDTLCNMSV